MSSLPQVLHALLLVVFGALGLLLVLGVMRVLNLAHGATMLVGAALVVVCIRAGLPPWLALGMAPLVGGLIGRLVERWLLPRQQRDLASVLVSTWAVALLLRQLVAPLFEGPAAPVDAPAGANLLLSGIAPQGWRLLLEALAVAFCAAAFWVALRSRRGLAARAALADRQLAARTGVDVDSIDRGAFTAGSVLACSCGALLAPLQPPGPGFGADLLLGQLLRALGL